MMNQNWNTVTYDKDMAFVSHFGESLISLLKPQPGEHIIDWGCGTGDLADRIAGHGATVTGIDASGEMIEAARSKYPKLTLIVADGQTYVSTVPADAIFSNAALHWLLDAETTVASIAASLRTGGRFVAEFGGARNVNSIVNGLPQAFEAVGISIPLQLPWYFPSIGQYTTLLEQHGLSVELAQCFDRPTPLEGGDQGLRIWLHTFANGILNKLTVLEQDKVITFLENELKPQLFLENRWIMDYRRIRVVAYKR